MQRILVVEDDPDLLFLYNTALVRNGFEVTLASKTGDALSMLEQETYDLIILDMNMPDAPGLDVVDYLKQHPQHNHTEVMVITANDLLRNQVLDKGVTTIMIKPVGIADIVAAIKMLID